MGAKSDMIKGTYTRKKIEGCSSSYFGVTKINTAYLKRKPSDIGKWAAYIKVDGKLCNLGVFDTEREAAIAHDKKAIQLGKPTNILKSKNGNN